MATPRQAPDIRVEIAPTIAAGVRPDEGDWIRVDGEGVYVDDLPVGNPPRSATLTKGRQQRLEEIEAAELKLVADNRNGRLDITNPAGEFYPDLDAQTRIRCFLDLRGGAGWEPWFHGYIERANTGWLLGDAWATIEAVDLFGPLARVTLPRSVLFLTQLDDGPLSVWPLADTTNIVEDVVGRSHGTYAQDPQAADALTPWDPLPAAAFGGAQSIVVPELPALGDEFSFEFLIRADDANASTDPIILHTQLFELLSRTGNTVGLIRLVRYPPAAEYGGIEVVMLAGGTATASTTGNVLLDRRIHHVVVTVDNAARARIYVDGLLPDQIFFASGVVDMPEGLTLRIGGTTGVNASLIGDLGHVALYPRQLVDGEVVSHYQATVAPWDDDLPGERLARVAAVANIDVADCDFDAGTTPLGPALLDSVSALAYMQQVALTDQATLFVSPDGKITTLPRVPFGAEGTRTYDTVRTVGRTPVVEFEREYSLDRLRNRAEVRRVGGIAQVAEDTPSRGKYGDFDATYETQHRTPQAARAMASRVVASDGKPRDLIHQITVKPRDGDVPDASALPELLDVITVHAHPPGRAEIVQHSTIEHIEHDIDWQAWDWTLTCGLEAVPEVRFWTWGVTRWGDPNHRWAP